MHPHDPVQAANGVRFSGSNAFTQLSVTTP